MSAPSSTAEGSSTTARSTGATADSYVGSLISLTSKSEIRYEGVLYNINTEESSIGLRNVRSFGTEGRKKDGPQVPPSDRIYEYILFRGSDIKDLQVKSAPSVQSTPPINNDPAIIQSHYPRPTTSPSTLPTNASGALPDLGSQSGLLGHTASNFQSGLPLYQPGLGPWGTSPPPTANANGLAMPMYWQGYYGAPGGLPQLHQQSLLHPPSGLSMPPSMQQMQYPGFNSSLPSGPSGPSNLPEYPSSMVQSSVSSLQMASTSAAPSMPSTLPPIQPMSLHSDTFPSMLTNKASISGIPITTSGASAASISPMTSSRTDVAAAISSSKPSMISLTPLPHHLSSQPASSVSGTSRSIPAESSTPSLITPGQLLQSAPAAVSAIQSSQTVQKDVEVVKVSQESSPDTSAPSLPEARPPLLPLPSPARAQKPNGTHYQMRQNYRGRGGRGAGMSRPVTKFNEEFDFMAMNEKFKKEEVWGDLGKSHRSNNMNGNDEEEAHEEEEVTESSKAVYNKDDFFDNLSCNAIDNGPNHGRVRFSEQMKLDSETFGDFSRYRGGRGGRGGRSRGSYQGRGGYGYGYGYRGRGRGGVSNHYN